MPELNLDLYFQRVNPTLRRPEEGAHVMPDVDLYGAWDRLSKMLFYTAPRTLDRTRANRNRFVPRVR
jgi:hypothetical protein